MIFVGIDVKAFVVVALVNVAAVVDVVAIVVAVVVVVVDVDAIAVAVVVVVVNVVAIVVVVVLSFRKPIKPTFYQEGEYLVSLFQIRNTLW